MREILLLLVLFLSSCSLDMCDNAKLYENISPDGNYVATTFERNCGATTPYIRVVSLRKSDSDFDAENADDWVFTLHEQTDIKTSWNGNNKLSILYHSTNDSPTQRHDWQNVKISFEKSSGGREN